jgi:hypothetical protein
MIKLTLREAFVIDRAYPHLPRMNVKTAYDFKRMHDEIKRVLKPIQEQRLEIIAAHEGEVRDDGVVKWKKVEDQTAADKEVNELFDHEVEIDREPIKLAAILGPDPAKYPEIQPEILSVLEKIIVE